MVKVLLVPGFDREFIQERWRAVGVATRYQQTQWLNRRLTEAHNIFEIKDNEMISFPQNLNDITMLMLTIWVDER